MSSQQIVNRGRGRGRGGGHQQQQSSAQPGGRGEQLPQQGQLRQPGTSRPTSSSSPPVSSPVSQQRLQTTTPINQQSALEQEMQSVNLSRPSKTTNGLVPITRPRNSKTGVFLYCTLGKTVKTIVTNHFEMKIDQNNSPQIYRYDVEISPSKTNKVKKRQVMDFAWRDAARNFGTNGTLAAYGYDGNKLLYSTVQLNAPKAVSILVPHGERNEEFIIEIIQLTKNGILSLADLLRDDIADVGEIIAALDVVLLTNPKVNYPTNLRRSYYYPLANPVYLRGGFKELWAGFYSSARQGEGWTMTLNVDVTASVVIQPLPLLQVYENCRRNLQAMDRQLREIKRDLKIDVLFGNRPHQKRVFQAVSRKISRTHRFEDTETKQTWILEQYYREKHGVTVKYPDYPLIQVKHKTMEVLFPMEFCTIFPGQLSPSKRESEDQAQLIRYMSSMKPGERLRRTIDDFNQKFATPEQVDLLRRFGITVSTSPMKIKEARVLPPVEVKGGGNAPLRQDAREVGKFQLGNRFYESPKDIGKWAVVETSGNLARNDVDEWIDLFRQGLNRKAIGALQPPIVEQAKTPETLEACFENLVEKQGVTFIVFLVSKANSLYGYIKQLGDRKYRIATQCCDVDKWQKMNNTYMDNLILKVNVKLEGINFVLTENTFQRNNLPPLMFDEPVLLVGADVTHAGAEEKTKPSIAAVVGSTDRHAAKYTAVITPQSRTSKDDENCVQEWISDLSDTMKKLLKAFYVNTKEKPKKIIFYRDGVSEGQYPIVLQKELSQIQRACRELQEDYRPAITYVVVRKRIKTKFFNVEQDGKVVNNVSPGTVVEVDITQPQKYFDWFMVPHYSPLGTARPTHYVVIYDDSRFSPNEIAYLTFALCHVFPRCPKAVSLPAPVYHAHLAAERATYHLAGQPFEPPRGIRDPAVLKQKQLEHARQVVTMSAEWSKPNYWL